MAKQKFCSDGCKECYNQDSQRGIIYPIMALLQKDIKGIKFVPMLVYGKLSDWMLFNWEDGCKMLNQCYYCRELLNQKG